MKTEILTKEATIYSKEFRDDIREIEQLDQNIVAEISKWTKKITKLNQAVDTDELIELSKNTSLPIDQLAKYLRPISWIAITSAKYRISINDVFDDLLEGGIISTKEASSRFLEMAFHVFELAKIRYKKTAPKLPLKYIRGISTKCIFIPEFEKSFNVENDNLSTYSPKMEGIYPAISLTLKFEDDSEEQVGIILDSEDLNILKRWLEFAEAELKIACKSIPAEYLVSGKD